MNRSISITVMVFCILSLGLRAQGNKTSSTHPGDYPFINQVQNKIEGNIESLTPLFKKLHILSENSVSGPVVPIVHIGDSHLQVGYLPMEIMTTLQKKFGNAGRGFVSPLKLAKTSQHNNYRIESPNRWIVSRATQAHPPFSVGLGALALRCSEETIRLTIFSRPESGLDYSFNRIKLFQSPTSSTLTTLGGRLLPNNANYPFLCSYELEELTHQITLSGRSNSSYDLYGVSLDNGRPGLLYHSIAIHTTRYANYAEIESFGRQIKSLSPKWVIISLGTNEAFYKSFSDEIFLNEVDNLVSTIREEMPEVAIMLTTPMAIKRRITKNQRAYYQDQPNIARIRNAIILYAQKHRLLYWDLYSIAGGESAPDEWVKAGLMTNDRIHLTVAGSKLQGRLLTKSIIHAYQNYDATLSR